jgi:uncharacterized membrane protein
VESAESPAPAGLSLNRIEAFSDGVIAIIITILVLEFKVPQIHGIENLAQALEGEILALLPKFIAYVISFLVLAVWWIAHHHLLHLLRFADRTVLWLNLLFLMFLSLIPFPTGLMGEYPDQPWAGALYGGVCFCTGLSFLWMRWHISRTPALLKTPIPDHERKRALRRGALSPVLYGAATLVACVSPKIAILIFALIPVYYCVPSQPTKRRTP